MVGVRRGAEATGNGDGVNAPSAIVVVGGVGAGVIANVGAGPGGYKGFAKQVE